MIDHDGDHIGGSAGYDPDSEVFIDFFQEGTVCIQPLIQALRTRNWPFTPTGFSSLTHEHHL